MKQGTSLLCFRENHLCVTGTLCNRRR